MRLRATCSAIILFSLYAGMLAAQVTSSSISGRVYDPAGKVIRQAHVTLEDPLHSFVKTLITDEAGGYAFIGLAPAVYTIRAEAPGFDELKRLDVALEVDSALDLDFRLKVGGPRTQVEVSAPASILQSETASVGAVIDQDFVATLPLNQRNFLQLAFLAPGVFPGVEGSQLSSNGGTAMEVNGGREESNNFLLDGVDNNDPYISGYVVEPPVDSVQEFKMVTSSYDAEYGRSGAGQINIVTRRGTNDYHASAYEYLRNKVLDSRNYFDGAGFIKPPYIRNQFGAGAGGPLRKDKTFFFANTDFLRQREGQSQQAVVPTDAERGGNLSAYLRALGTTITNPLTGLPINPAAVPVSPIAADILKLYPEPNLTGAVNNYLGQPVLPTNRTENTFRGDHQISPNDELTLRYSQGIVNIFQPYPEGVSTTVQVPGFGDYDSDHTHNAMIREEHSFGANAINSAIIGFNRFSRDFLVQNSNENVGKLWGVSWLNLPARDYGYPGISVTGFSQVGDDSAFPNLRHTNTYQAADSFTLLHGRNTIKFGADVRKLQLNGHLDELARGSLTFAGGVTGSPLGDLLLGYPNFGLQAQVNNSIRLRSMSYDTFLQDEWKVRRNIVLTLGGRYEFNSPATDPYNDMSELDLKTGQVVQVGTNGVSDSGISPDYKNFAPRVGIAWNVAPNFVLRAGYGDFYDAGMFILGSVAYFNPPQFVLNVFFPSPAGLLTLNNPFPANAGYTPPASLSALSPSNITPYMQQWNLSAEEAIGRRGTLSLSYVGSTGTHLIRVSDLNQPLAGSPADLQSRRPYPQYSSVFYVQTEGSSNFNALEVHYKGQVAPGVSLWGGYTYSHSLDGQSAFLGDVADPNFPQNSHDLAAEHGPSSFDMRNRFVAAYVVSLPHTNRWTRNTDFQGIVTAESGQPFTPTLSPGNDNSNTGNSGQQAGSDRPNVIGNPNAAVNPATKTRTRTTDQWFNTAAFAVAPPNTFGDAGRNSLIGPNYSSFDLSLSRRFILHDRTTATFEAQSFNLLNHPSFALPNAYADQGSFGTISSTLQLNVAAERQLQFALRLAF